MSNVAVMKLAGLEKAGDLHGECLRPGYNGWIDVMDISYGVGRPFGALTPIGTNLTSFIFSKKLDILSARISQLCASGQVVPRVTICLLDDKTRRVIRKLECTDVLVSSYSCQSAKQGYPTELVGMSARSAKMVL